MSVSKSYDIFPLRDATTGPPLVMKGTPRNVATPLSSTKKSSHILPHDFVALFPGSTGLMILPTLGAQFNAA